MKFLLILLLFPFTTLCQIGGIHTFEFLNISTSARMTALGGNHISIPDNDVTIGFNNPALITKNMHSQASIGGIKYFSGIYFGNANYAHTFNKYGTFAGGLQYVNYGNFSYTDETGAVLSGFSADENNLTIGWAYPFDSVFSFGANFKMIYSQLEGYNSFGMAVDLAGSYLNQKKKLSISAVIKNAGLQLDTYVKGNREPLPFDIQLGVTKRLKHVPFRLSVFGHHLYQFDIRYDDPSALQPTTFSNDTSAKPKKYIIDKIFRHFIFGGEVLLSKNFELRLGYNHLRRAELSIDDKFTMAGFSWGFGIHIKKFEFSYGRSIFHAAGTSNHVTFAVRISELISSRATKNVVQ